jgi:hypothetical protein
MDAEHITDAEIKRALMSAPKWIAPRNVRDTLKAWQPLYPYKLTVHDAVEILTKVGRLFEILYGSSEPSPSRPIPSNVQSNPDCNRAELKPSSGNVEHNNWSQ